MRLLILGSATSKITNDPHAKVLAYELYKGPRYGCLKNWYKEASDDAAKNMDVWILSGKYGLISLWEEIYSYNAAMTPANAERLEPILRQQVQDLLAPGNYDEIYVSMSLRYKRTIIHLLREYLPNARIVVPDNWDGFGLSELKAWLFKEL